MPGTYQIRLGPAVEEVQPERSVRAETNTANDARMRIEECIFWLFGNVFDVKTLLAA